MRAAFKRRQLFTLCSLSDITVQLKPHKCVARGLANMPNFEYNRDTPGAFILNT
jgi:hypothetical protein